MNFTFDVTELTEAIQRVFPSPTGVNHHEFDNVVIAVPRREGFPSPTGVTNYESAFGKTAEVLYKYVFPSPTGVTNYEFSRIIIR